nr:hypothetical protein BaRGS_032103 [Batillaria attramentaria]
MIPTVDMRASRPGRARAWRVVLDAGFLRVCPIQPHFLRRICLATGSCPARSHSSSFRIFSGHRMLKMRLRQSKPLRITFGFTPNHSHSKNEDYGVMFYHRNRLIKAFEKLGYQKQANDLGVGVVGVVQVDFLKPIHNKQDFEKDEKYNAIMSAIAVKLNDYWNEKKNGQPSQQMPEEVSRCDIPEEPEDEDEAVQRPTYEKTFKKKQEEKKRRRQAEIDAKERELQAKEAELLERQRRQQMNEVSSSQESRRNIASLQRELIAAKRREETQKRLILQIQQQKKQLEEQRTSLMAAAHSLQTTNTTSAELLEVADALTSESPVSSTRFVSFWISEDDIEHIVMEMIRVNLHVRRLKVLKRKTHKT